MAGTRRPAVAGTFYPGSPRALEEVVRGYLREAAAPVEPAAKALIAPHAGYVYSGAVAASAYVRIAPRAAEIRRVVLLGPAHRVALRGLAAPGADAFETPLGPVPIDRAAIDRALALPQVVASDAAHAGEHSLEVQLPFLQLVLDDFALAPFVVGDATPEQVAQVLELLWGGPETIVVVSSDLSHYLSYDAARAIDRQTAQAILDLASVSLEQACGGMPINGLLLAARLHGLTPQLLDLRNSGDTAGDQQRVVGYGAFSFGEGHVH